jgi:hypothetical protein
MLDIQEISINICILAVLYNIVYYEPKLNNYSNDTKFNFYRGLMCISFTCIGLNILLKHVGIGILHPFSFKHNDMIEAYNLFFTYLIFDLVNMIAMRNKRIDLYIHHILCIGSLIISSHCNRFGYLHSILLICEVLSTVSGIDCIATEDNNKTLSYYCKKYRKIIIKYIRLPIWLTLFLFVVRFTNKMPTLLWYNGIITASVMIFLDNYWEQKCDKVIKLYE